MSGPILTLAEQLVRGGALRSHDAIHVASGSLAKDVSGGPLPFVTADVRQRKAAAQAGLQVVWVE